MPGQVFKLHVRFGSGERCAVLPGVLGSAPASTWPECSSFRVGGVVGAGQLGAGRAHSRFQQVASRGQLVGAGNVRLGWGGMSGMLRRRVQDVYNLNFIRSAGAAMRPTASWNTGDVYPGVG